MYEEISQQMREAQQGIFRLQKIEAMLAELHKQKEELEKKAAELKETLDKENIDVEKLEGKGLAHIFHSILGNLEERTAKERQEALAARLKYDQALRDLEGVEYEIAGLTAERPRYRSCEADYRELFARKKEQLLLTNHEAAQEILDITGQIASARNTVKEIREALHAGNEVIRHLNSASDSLNSAEGWGTWDIFGGGLIADMIKHSHIDDAKNEVSNTQQSLRKFRTELADVKIDSSINIDVNGFGKFADFFFDGLIADWCMQSRIHDSQDSVENVKSQVRTVMTKLGSMESRLLSHVEKLEQELNEQVMKA
jgi:hypothetical protein